MYATVVADGLILRHSTKITRRGGNKRRVNERRQEAKLQAQGAKAPSSSAKDTIEARRLRQERARLIANELKAQAPTHVGSAVRMAAKPKANAHPNANIRPTAQTATTNSLAVAAEKNKSSTASMSGQMTSASSTTAASMPHNAP